MAAWMLLIVFIQAFITATSSPTQHGPTRRWYGVRYVDLAHAGGVPDTATAWPLAHTSNGDAQPVRYCYQSEQDYADLDVLVRAAAAQWLGLVAVTSLHILPDDEGIGGSHTICDTADVREDALRISRGNVWSTTTGYMMGQRHSMILNPRAPGADSPDPQDVLYAAHEFGHAIGLHHEMARSNAHRWITFNCNNLRDYEMVLNRINSGTWDRAMQGDTIELACSDYNTAHRYDFSAQEFLMLPQHFEYQFSLDFDEESIVLYSSYHAARPGANAANFPEGAVLVAHELDQPNHRIRPVYEGGKRNVADAHISAGDMARVCQLYGVGNNYCSQLRWQPANPAWGP